jgi:hypothetical protein
MANFWTWVQSLLPWLSSINTVRLPHYPYTSRVRSMAFHTKIVRKETDKTQSHNITHLQIISSPLMEHKNTDKTNKPKRIPHQANFHPVCKNKLDLLLIHKGHSRTVQCLPAHILEFYILKWHRLSLWQTENVNICHPVCDLRWTAQIMWSVCMHSNKHTNSTTMSQRMKVDITNMDTSRCSSDTVIASLMGKSLTLLQPKTVTKLHMSRYTKGLPIGVPYQQQILMRIHYYVDSTKTC